MAVYNKFNQFVEDKAHKVHDLGSDQLTVALTNTLPVAGDAVLTDIAEISYTNLSPRNITTSASAQASGTYKLTLTDLILTASSGSVGPFRYIVIYNSTAAGGPLIAWYDYGSALTLLDTETLTIDFDGTNGFHQET